MANKRKRKKLNTSEAWTEEELANYLGFKFIAGFTEGGAPFGIVFLLNRIVSGQLTGIVPEQ